MLPVDRLIEESEVLVLYNCVEKHENTSGVENVNVAIWNDEEFIFEFDTEFKSQYEGVRSQLEFIEIGYSGFLRFDRFELELLRVHHDTSSSSNCQTCNIVRLSKKSIKFQSLTQFKNALKIISIVFKNINWSPGQYPKPDYVTPIKFDFSSRWMGKEWPLLFDGSVPLKIEKIGF